MKTNLLLGLALFSLFLAFTDCGTPEQLSFTGPWEEDLYCFQKNLEEKHADLYFQGAQDPFRNRVETLQQEADQLPQATILFELAKLIALIGDSHTNLRYGNRLHFWPFRLLWLSDGIVPIYLNPAHRAYLGKRLVSLNGHPIEAVVDSFRTIIAYENESLFKGRFGNYVAATEFLEGFQLVDGTDQLELQFLDGSVLTINKSFEDLATIQLTSRPLYLQNRDRIYWHTVQFDWEGVYVQYNACQEGSRP